MGNIKLYNGNVVKLIMNMNDENMNLRVLAKKCGMDWLVCRQILNTLYIHNIIDIQNKKQILYFNLTNEGKEVRELFLKINTIISRGRERTITGLMGYSSRDDLLRDINKDSERVL